MIVVLDTNVLVAALVARGLCLEVVQRAIALRCVATSMALVQELEDTLREKFVLTPGVEAFLRLLSSQITIVEPVLPGKPICRDPDDDVVLGTAVAARATFVVSGDRDLLDLKEYEGIRIITPRQFLELLSGNPGRP